MKEKAIFENIIINLFDFFYSNSRNVSSVFNSEHDIHAFLFMELFRRLKEENLLFDNDGGLRIGVDVPRKLTNEEVFKKFNNRFDMQNDPVLSHIEKTDKKIKNKLKGEDDPIELLNLILKKITINKYIDLAVSFPPGFSEEKRLLIASEVKDSSTGYYKGVNKIIDDLIKLYLFKSIGYCDLAYMIFLDTIPTNKFGKGRQDIFRFNGEDLVINEDNKILLKCLESVQFYYIWIPQDIDSEYMGNEKIIPRDIGTIKLFSMKNIKIPHFTD